MGGEAKLLLMCCCWVGFWAAFRLFLPLFVPTAVRWMRCGSQSLLLDDAGYLYDTNGEIYLTFNDITSACLPFQRCQLTLDVGVWRTMWM